MQRQRKKDLNLKPNRVLDKRSSRGMIYENEELRLRTMAIADDVDRGQNDIKKLRRENDHLKRELWALRDECEKLEEILKRIISAGTFDPAELPYHELFGDVEWGEEGEEGSNYEGTSVASTSRKGSFQAGGGGGGGEDGEGFSGFIRTLFCSEEDGEDTGTVIRQHQGQNQGEGGQDQVGVVEQVPPSSGVEFEGGILEQSAGHQHVSSGTKYILGPDLEPLVEEGEVISAGQSLSSIPPSSGEEIGESGREMRRDSDDLPDPSSISGLSECNPVIQITGPLTTPPHDTPPSPSPPTTPTPPPGQGFQEGGCIADISAKYETISSLHINSSPTTTPTPPAAAKKSFTLKYRHPSQPVPSFSSSHRHSLAHPHHGGWSAYSSHTPCPSCYQSEPILSPHGLEIRGGDWNPATVSSSPWTRGLEEVLAVGVVDNPSGCGPIQGQQVIDALESGWDPSLERVSGIRVLGGVVFLRCRDQEAVTSLLQRFGETATPLPVGGARVTFSHGSIGVTELRLVGLGPEVSDASVIALLNGYGQVVGGVERRSYKGVQIWERDVKIHLVLGTGLLKGGTISLGGYTATISVIREGNPAILERSQRPDVDKMMSDGKSGDLTVNEESVPKNVQGEHKSIARCASSTPRLELGPSPSSPVPVGRKVQSASICAASPNSPKGGLFQKNPQLHKTSAILATPPPAAVVPSILPTSATPTSPSAPVNSSPTPVVKKPLTRLLKSPPGTLVPPTPASEVTESPAVRGLRSALTRTLSIDPRRGSTTSNNIIVLGENNNLPPTKDMRRISNAFYARFGSQRGHVGGHAPLSQMNSSSSSHNSGGRGGVGGGLGIKGEQLPWCGCWGNGCI